MTCPSSHEISAQGIVLKQEHGRVQLSVQRQSACKACSESQQCGSKQDDLRAQSIWLESTRPLAIGEVVAVSMPENALLHAALLMYGLPLLGFLMGLLRGALRSDLAAVSWALVGLTLGLWLVRRLSARSISPIRLNTDT